MKKLFAQNVLLGFILLAATGCLKDTGFEDQKYGIDIKEVKGVAFTQAATGEISTGLTSQTASATVSGPIIALEQDGYPSSPVNVTIQTNNNLVTAAGYTPFPTNAYTLNFTTVTIPAGKKVSDTLKITFPNSSTLDPTQTYAIGFTIVSVDQGYKIAANQKEVLFTFTVKNKYDGKYRVTGTFSDLGLGPAATSVLPNEVQLITTGPNTVSVNRLINGTLFPGYLFSNNGAGTYYGNWGVIFTFDPITDNLTAVTNFYGQGTNPQGRAGAIDASGTVEGKNKYFTADHSIKAKYVMTQPNASTIRARFDELYTYIGPR